ncbi:hypothetical protein [Taklimakanibacter albus]|uniref:Uncharacterized protein n=1 Tax=Taklimakanibacter albus TaxID=2800327 RepID=A0ACC5RFV1_9HYPH|nr:hypothetical protein [Aestuariivirga sp. YIM B02566]MBK1871586.1 hypothetical protein [Aestuariivirga sp. YIM B02566]
MAIHVEQFTRFDPKPEAHQGVTVRFEALQVPDETAMPDYMPDPDEGFQAQHKARLDDFVNGAWCYVGVVCRAHVNVIKGGHGVSFHIDSPGVWGVESDSDASYFAELQQEQQEEVKAMIEALRSEPILYVTVA